MTDQLSSAILREFLPERDVRYFKQTSSTNHIAAKLVTENAPAGSIVVADEQLSGRGRLAREWQTPYGEAIAMSIILRPNIDAAYLQRITMLVGVVVTDIVSKLVDDVGMKWPNDIMVAGKKVCGILAETQWEGNKLAAVVVGIGLNVRVDFRDTPLADIATSLEDHTDVKINRAELIQEITLGIDHWMQYLSDSYLLSAYRERLNMLGSVVTLSTGRGKIQGKAADIDSAGALLIETSEGTERVLVGDILP